MSRSDDDEIPTLEPCKIPVTILTGFLGSGKTTLLNYILTSQDHKLRIAVVVNEFEFGKKIEKGITLKSSMKSDDEWIELSNGCMCCSAQDQTVQALENLVKRQCVFDLVLIETSGLADPAAVAGLFWQDDTLGGILYLSGIVAVVDSKLLCKHLADSDFAHAAEGQLLVADKIILNKMDIVSPEEKQNAIRAVQEINSSSDIITTSFSRIEEFSEIISGNTATINSSATSNASPNLSLRSLLFINTTNSFTGDHLHNHPASITTYSFELPNVCADSCREVEYMCRDLLYHDGAETFEIVRLKAVVWIKEGNGSKPYQLQVIGQLFDVFPMAATVVSRNCACMIVLSRKANNERVKEIVKQYLKQV